MLKGGKGVGHADGHLGKNAPGEGMARAKALRWGAAWWHQCGRSGLREGEGEEGTDQIVQGLKEPR